MTLQAYALIRSLTDDTLAALHRFGDECRRAGIPPVEALQMVAFERAARITAAGDGLSVMLLAPPEPPEPPADSGTGCTPVDQAQRAEEQPPPEVACEALPDPVAIAKMEAIFPGFAEFVEAQSAGITVPDHVYEPLASLEKPRVGNLETACGDCGATVSYFAKYPSSYRPRFCKACRRRRPIAKLPQSVLMPRPAEQGESEIPTSPLGVSPVADVETVENRGNAQARYVERGQELREKRIQATAGAVIIICARCGLEGPASRPGGPVCKACQESHDVEIARKTPLAARRVPKGGWTQIVVADEVPPCARRLQTFRCQRIKCGREFKQEAEFGRVVPYCPECAADLQPPVIRKETFVGDGMGGTAEGRVYHRTVYAPAGWRDEAAATDLLEAPALDVDHLAGDAI